MAERGRVICTAALFTRILITSPKAERVTETMVSGAERVERSARTHIAEVLFGRVLIFETSSSAMDSEDCELYVMTT
jgi:hypothetical protein